MTNEYTREQYDAKVNSFLFDTLAIACKLPLSNLVANEKGLVYNTEVVIQPAYVAKYHFYVGKGVDLTHNGKLIGRVTMRTHTLVFAPNQEMKNWEQYRLAFAKYAK